MKLKLNAALKALAVNKLGIKADATDDEFRKAIAKELSGKKPKITLAEIAKAGKTEGEKKPPVEKKGEKKTVAIDVDSPEFTAALQKNLSALGVGNPNTQSMTPESLFSKASGVEVRVIAASERYSNTTKEAICPNRVGKNGDGSLHPFAGQPARIGGNILSHPSDLAKAVSAAHFKWCLSKYNQSELPQNLRFNEHDKDLLHFAMKNMPWTGIVGGRGSGEGISVDRRKLNDHEMKALLDDSVSGGIEAVPVVFDDAIILTPVLYGQFFPNVDVRDVKGRRVKGSAMSEPTFQSGTSEGTPVQPLNTASFVTAFDTIVYTATGAMEIGRDFEEDSPIAFGSTILEYYGMKALEYLDRVIVIGNGVNEPEGIFTASGVSTFPSSWGSAGPITVSDMEGLMFGVGKKFRDEPGAYMCYASNDQLYRRTRSIQVGADDQRRVFGMDHQNYQLLGMPWKISNDIPNGYAAMVNLKRYRMYRRLGTTVRIEDGGRELALANTRLIIVRMRFGGRMNHASAACKITDLKSN